MTIEIKDPEFEIGDVVYYHLIDDYTNLHKDKVFTGIVSELRFRNCKDKSILTGINITPSDENESDESFERYQFNKYVSKNQEEMVLNIEKILKKKYDGIKNYYTNLLSGIIQQQNQIDVRLKEIYKECPELKPKEIIND